MDFELNKCMLTKNDCYKDAYLMNPVGIVVHSTGANNPYLRRYVQPNDGILGINSGNNHWNREGLNVCVHAFIGKDQNGTVRCYQTLPFNYCCWGIGRGSKGSYNYPATKKYPNDRSFIQFEICEDDLTNETYFNEVMKTAQQFCAYLMCKYPAIQLSDVVSHHEGHVRGFGSNHGDIDHWLKKFGKTMDWFRSCVSGYMTTTTTTTTSTATEVTTSVVTDLKNGDVIELVDGATYYNGKAVPTWVMNSTLYYRGTNKNGVIISTKVTGAVTGTVAANMIKGYEIADEKLIQSTVVIDKAKAYDASLKGTYKTTASVNIRSGASVAKTKVATVPKDLTMTMNGYHTGSWYLLAFTYNNIRYTGYLKSAYLKKV